MPEIGKKVQQKEGFSAFIPHPFPPKDLSLSKETIEKIDTASRKIGELKGTARMVPDLDLFLFMYIRKESTASSQIEGIEATLGDIASIDLEKLPKTPLEGDIQETLQYSKALMLGMHALEKLPISERLLKSMHEELMKGERKAQMVTPGKFRETQNWIGGSSPSNARFVPPPAHELPRVLSELERFIHNKTDKTLPLVRLALIHAQFEVIHPFLDGNGRTGRLLIPLFLKEKKLLEEPILFLSWYLLKNRERYYDLLFEYGRGNIDAWVTFFAEAIIATSNEAIEVSKKIVEIRQRDREKIQKLPRIMSERLMKLLKHLFKVPSITTKDIEEIAEVKTSTAYNMVNKMVELNILHPQKEKGKWNVYLYKEYFESFEKDSK